MSGTAILDVLMNGIGAMLAIAFLFLTLVGSPPVAGGGEGYEEKRVYLRTLAIQSSVATPVPMDLKNTPVRIDVFTTNHDLTVPECGREAILRLDAQKARKCRGQQDPTLDGELTAGVELPRPFMGIDTRIGDTILFVPKPRMGCLQVQYTYRYGAADSPIHVATTAWFAGQPTIPSLFNGALVYSSAREPPVLGRSYETVSRDTALTYSVAQGQDKPALQIHLGRAFHAQDCLPIRG